MFAPFQTQAIKMYYIEQHSNSEILELGIKWALYREPKPKDEDYKHDAFIERIKKEDYKNVNLIAEYHEANAKWQQSRIAYLKEPEFKHGEKCYDSDGTMYIWRRNDKQDDDFSHYYPGQQVESSFKYVREEKIGNFFAKNIKDRWIYEWQEVEEPLSDAKKVYRSRAEDDMKEVAKFQEDIDKGKILAEILN